MRGGGTGPALDAGERYKKIVADTARLVDLFLDWHGEQPERIVLDVDADGRCPARPPGRPLLPWVLPHLLLLAALYLLRKQLLGARLRTADRDAADGTVEELERIVGLDPEALAWGRDLDCAGIAGSAATNCWPGARRWGWSMCWESRRTRRLKRSLAPEMERARQECERTGQAARVFKDFRYRTLDSWSRERCVSGKAEHLPRGANPRFVVTSLGAERMAARALYEEVYCARGDMENRIKEQQLALFADRTSAQTMRANQLRLYFASFAYALLELLRRWGLSGTRLARAQCGTIRLKLLKIGVRIRVSVRAVRLSFDEGFPEAGLFGTGVGPSPEPAPALLAAALQPSSRAPSEVAGDQCVCRAGCKRKQAPTTADLATLTRHLPGSDAPRNFARLSIHPKWTKRLRI